MRALQLIVVSRATVAAAAGVEKIELGTWDVAAARARNARLLQQRGTAPSKSHG